MHDGYDFSFSGLKSATARLVAEEGDALNRADAAASFQEAVCDVLTAKLARAAKEYEAKEAHLAGGVSANLRLRELAAERLTIPLKYPKKISYCTDNAAMIAAAGLFNYQKNPKAFNKFQIIEAEACLWSNLVIR